MNEKDNSSLFAFLGIHAASIGCGIAIGYNQAKGINLNSEIADNLLSYAPMLLNGGIAAFTGHGISRQYCVDAVPAVTCAFGAAGAGVGYLERMIGEYIGQSIGNLT